MRTWVSGAKGEHVKVGETLEMADPMAQIYFLNGSKLSAKAKSIFC